MGNSIQHTFRLHYKALRAMEHENKDVLLDFQDDYPGVLNGDNLADILKAARKKTQKQ